MCNCTCKHDSLDTYFMPVSRELLDQMKDTYNSKAVHMKAFEEANGEWSFVFMDCRATCGDTCPAQKVEMPVGDK